MGGVIAGCVCLSAVSRVLTACGNTIAKDSDY